MRREYFVEEFYCDFCEEKLTRSVSSEYRDASYFPKDWRYVPSYDDAGIECEKLCCHKHNVEIKVEVTLKNPPPAFDC